MLRFPAVFLTLCVIIKKIYLYFSEIETLHRKLGKAKSRIATLEKKLQESVANSSYFNMLQEKTDVENQLQQVQRKVPLSMFAINCLFCVQVCSIGSWLP